MKKTFRTQFDYGDVVYLKTDPEVKRVVSGFLLRPNNVTIGLVKGEEETWHQLVELMPAKKIVIVKGFCG